MSPFHHDWYTGARAYCGRDMALRLRGLQEAVNALADMGHSAERLKRPLHWDSSSGEVPLTHFLSTLRTKHLSDRNNLDSEFFQWAMLDAYFANEALHSEKRLFVYEFGFYALAALNALHYLMHLCKQHDTIPYVFIVTTQGPAEMMFSESPGTDEFHYWSALSGYVDAFSDVIRKAHDADRDLRVERHCLVGANGLDRKELGEVLLRPDDYTRKADGDLPEEEDDAPGKFRKWIADNHINHLPDSHANPETVAFVNYITNNNLPKQGTLPPNTHDMGVDLIAFGESRITVAGEQAELITSWLGALLVIDPIERAQGKYVRLLPSETLNATERLPLLGYEFASFAALITALRTGRNSQGNGERVLRLSGSVPIAGEAPWSLWWDSSGVNDVPVQADRFPVGLGSWNRAVVQVIKDLIRSALSQIAQQNSATVINIDGDVVNVVFGDVSITYNKDTGMKVNIGKITGGNQQFIEELHDSAYQGIPKKDPRRELINTLRLIHARVWHVQDDKPAEDAEQTLEWQKQFELSLKDAKDEIVAKENPEQSILKRAFDRMTELASKATDKAVETAVETGVKAMLAYYGT